MRFDVVIEGGGVKGIAFAGALKALEEGGYDEPQSIAGTSAGAIVGALLAVGYKADDLFKMMMQVDFRNFKDKGILDSVPIVGPLASAIFECGIYEGDFLELWLEEKLATAPRPAKTFGDLECDFRCIATDLTNGRILILPDALEFFFHINPKTFSIAKAVRMSMSIPFFFEPVRLVEHTADPEQDSKLYDTVIVDGGVISNFPVFLFDTRDGAPRWPTFGLNLYETRKRMEIKNPVDMAMALINTMISSRDPWDMANSDIVRTINIPSHGVASTDFEITDNEKLNLYNGGQFAAREFLKTWDFERYKEQYRRQGDPTK